MDFDRFYDNESQLLDDVKSPNSHRRKKAAFVLGTYNHPDAVDILISFLNDSDETVREQAANSLDLRRNLRAIQPLIDFFLDRKRQPKPDEDGDVMWASAVALEKFGKPAAEKLIDHIEKPHVVWLLGQIGDDIAVEPLIALYKAGIEPYAVIAALGEIGSSKAMPFLLTLDKSDIWVNEAIRKIRRHQSV